jgi:hypothetical protein
MILRTHAKIVKLAKDEDLWTIARVGARPDPPTTILRFSIHWSASLPSFLPSTLPPPLFSSQGTVGFSGAELANLINQAALQASRQEEDVITLATLEWAKDKILMGAERKKAVITEHDRKVTAYHEGGHALCALYAEGAIPVYKATIVPRGNALGASIPHTELDSAFDSICTSDECLCLTPRCFFFVPIYFLPAQTKLLTPFQVWSPSCLKTTPTR